ncbi:rhodanese-like domain-containing protein [Dyella sp. RRB7]|uniref:rhodanese-like domain-containing protein n=1 Tax=Dyella sp. RRB7 TaxID=2919502 RepID=UPI001FA9A79F|nr:rhodanese-like domain-containing protein [Dyella sp. RRB7]
MSSVVQRFPAAASHDALAHFQARLGFETDCADVYYATQHETADFVLLDVRTPALYAVGHVPGAINMPTRTISDQRLADYRPDTLFVVYCAGPHCNGANKAAVKLAQLGRPVKEMIGGLTGWLDEGFGLERG